jgi:hypothetical protein
LLLGLPLAGFSQSHPDFSGIWMPDRTPGYDARAFPRADWPYTGQGAQWQDAFQAEFNPIEDDPVIYREPIQMRGVWIDSPETAIMEYSCSDEIYQQHLERVRSSRQ